MSNRSIARILIAAVSAGWMSLAPTRAAEMRVQTVLAGSFVQRRHAASVAQGGAGQAGADEEDALRDDLGAGDADALLQPEAMVEQPEPRLHRPCGHPLFADLGRQGHRPVAVPDLGASEAAGDRPAELKGMHRLGRGRGRRRRWRGGARLASWFGRCDHHRVTVPAPRNEDTLAAHVRQETWRLGRDRERAARFGDPIPEARWGDGIVGPLLETSPTLG